MHPVINKPRTCKNFLLWPMQDIVTAKTLLIYGNWVMPHRNCCETQNITNSDSALNCSFFSIFSISNLWPD